MGRQIHLALREREDVMLMRRDGRGVSEIARAIGRRLACRRRRALDDERVFNLVRDKMPRALEGHPLGSVTLDRGKEFADHAQVTADIDVQFYFAPPHHPWQRGTNENTNGLLREYFPKGESLARVSEKRVQEVYDKLNRRPRRRLGYRTPHEAHCSETLRLIRRLKGNHAPNRLFSESKAPGTTPRPSFVTYIVAFGAFPGFIERLSQQKTLLKFGKLAISATIR